MRVREGSHCWDTQRDPEPCKRPVGSGHDPNLHLSEEKTHPFRAPCLTGVGVTPHPTGSELRSSVRLLAALQSSLPFCHPKSWVCIFQAPKLCRSPSKAALWLSGAAAPPPKGRAAVFQRGFAASPAAREAQGRLPKAILAQAPLPSAPRGRSRRLRTPPTKEIHCAQADGKNPCAALSFVLPGISTQVGFCPALLG